MNMHKTVLFYIIHCHLAMTQTHSASVDRSIGAVSVHTWNESDIS